MKVALGSGGMTVEAARQYANIDRMKSNGAGVDD